ncbi:hypothetical protein YC2023_099928 [Brassica napus]
MERNFFRENLAFRAIRQLSIFVISSCDSTRFCSLRLLELGISPTALVAKASTFLILLTSLAWPDGPLDSNSDCDSPGIKYSTHHSIGIDPFSLETVQVH